MDRKITNMETDFSKWYNEVVQRADLAEHAPVRGCMIIKPYGYSLWENIQKILDKMFKDTGHSNAYFPLFIPYSFMQKEKQHVEGFSPEVAVVTHGGGKELEEPLIVRPTSETIIGYAFSKWIDSYRQLPMLINQWANVVRWEMRPRLFLRTTEFLWQEGHTAHATFEDAEEETLRMLHVYKEFSENYAAIPVYEGRKSVAEKFAGADTTYAIEGMMKDGKALQMGTSHNLGQNFAKAFDIKFLDQDGNSQYAWMTSWGLSTRVIGAIVMAHGDNQGLVLPPRIAPVKCVLVPIYKTDEQKSQVFEFADTVKKALGETLPHTFDDRESMTPGFKFNEWELRGVPVRIEIGPRDVENRSVVLARRDMPGKEGKSFVKLEELASAVTTLLEDIQQNMFKRADVFRRENTCESSSYDEFKQHIEKGFAYSYWCGETDCELAIKEDTKATSRCIPVNQDAPEGKCVRCGKPAKEKTYFAKAY